MSAPARARRTMRESRWPGRSRSRAGRCRWCTAWRWKSGVRQVSCPIFPTRPLRGRATIGTWCAGGICRPTSSRTPSRSCSRNASREVALALHRAIADGSLPPPRRTIRFLWTPEIAGTLAYLVSRPEVTGRLRAGIHMDMVGGLLGTIRGTFHLSRSAESVPHIANQIAEAWFNDVVRTSAWYAEHGGDPYDGLVWPPGSREAFLGDLRAIEMGSDHQVLQDGAFRIPMVYFHDWPDVTIHTNKDQPENLDAPKLGRVAFMGAGIAWTLAALPDSEAMRLVALVRASAEEGSARARGRAALGGDPRDGVLFEREALAQGTETLRSVASLWPVTAATVAREVDRLQRLQPMVPAAAERDARVPVRSVDVRGPLEVYNYDYLAEVLGPDADVSTALSRRANGEVLGYEALNLVDGRRSVSDIRDILTGRYDPVPLREVAEYLALLERARVVQFRGPQEAGRGPLTTPRDTLERR